MKRSLPTPRNLTGEAEKARTNVTVDSQCHGRHFKRVAVFVVLRIFLSSLTMCNISSFITRSVQ